MANILFFISTTKIGGAETNVLKISRELTLQSNHNVFWCVLDDNGPLFSLIDFPIQKYIELGLYYKKPVRFYSKFKKFVQENNIEIVFNFGLRVEIISRILSKRLGIKKVVSNIRSTDDWRKWYHTFIDKVTQSSVDHWVSNSEAGKEAFNKRENIPLSSITVINNFFEVPINNYKFQLNIPNEEHKLNLGILANINHNKGYWDLLQLLKMLRQKKYNVKLYYAGYDRSNGAFEEEIKKDGLSGHIEYLGYISDKVILFDKIDLFILPSYLEGMPTVLLEAMSYEKPIISTTVGGIPELVESGISGELVDPGDIESMFQAIEKVFHNPNHYISAANKRLKNFSKDIIMNQWNELIENLIIKK